MKKQIFPGAAILIGLIMITAFAIKGTGKTADACCEKKMECAPTPTLTDPAMILENFSRQFVTFSGL